MVIYKCDNCFRCFDKKCNYDRHLRRLNKCSTSKEVSPIKKLLNIEIENENKYKCDFCDKSFKNKTYFRKHLKELCPRNFNFEQLMIKEKIKRINKIKKENYNLKEKIYEKMKTLPRYMIENGKIVNVEKHYLNYYDQKNILSYGHEKTYHIRDKTLKKIIGNPEMGLIRLIQEIHFNNNIPRNRNVFMRNKKSNMIEFYKEGEWRNMPKKDLFQNLIVTKKDIMDDYFDKLVEVGQINEKQKLRYENFSNSLDKYIQHIVFDIPYDITLKRSKMVYERIFKLINLLFLNNQKIEVVLKPDDDLKEKIEDIDEDLLDKKIKELEDEE